MAKVFKRKNSPHWWVSSQEQGRQVRRSTGIRHNGRPALPQGSPVHRILAGIEERNALGRFNVPVTWQPVSVEDALRAQKELYLSRADAEEISSSHAWTLCTLFDAYLPHLQAVGLNMLGDLTPALARAYQAHRLQKIKPTSFKRELQHLTAIWNRYIEEEKAPLENHWTKLRVGGEHAKKRALTSEELNLLSCLLPDAPPAMQYLTRMGFYMGARISMATRLNVDDVDFDKRLVRFPKVKRKEHVQVLHEKLYAYLMDYPLQAGGWFVPQITGWSSYYCRWMDTVRERTGLFEGITHHCLRVTFNTMMVESDLPEQVTMDIIGHSSRAAHDRYKDIQASRFQSSIEKTIRGL